MQTGIYSDITEAVGLIAQTVTADTNCTSIDLKNISEAGFSVNVGNSGDTLSGSVYIELEVEEVSVA